MMDSRCLTSLAPISLLFHTQESKPARTEYRIRILNLNLHESSEFSGTGGRNPVTPYGEHKDDLPPTEPPPPEPPPLRVKAETEVETKSETVKIQGLSESHKRNFRNRENLGI